MLAKLRQKILSWMLAVTSYRTGGAKFGVWRLQLCLYQAFATVISPITMRIRRSMLRPLVDQESMGFRFLPGNGWRLQAQA
jgi:hypothetical protein